jgi:hypothetical protein
MLADQPPSVLLSTLQRPFEVITFDKLILPLMKALVNLGGYFDDSSNEIEYVKVMYNQDDLGEIPLLELKNLFASIGLPVKDGQARKYVNDATSSQRKSCSTLFNPS